MNLNTEKKKQFIINTVFYAIIICLILMVIFLEVIILEKDTASM